MSRHRHRPCPRELPRRWATMPRWSCPHLDHCFSTLECQERKLGRIMKNCRMPRQKHSLSKLTFSILSDYLILFYQDLGEVGSNCSSPVFISARRSLWSTKPPSSWTSKYQSSKTRQTASRLYLWITTNRWTLAKKRYQTNCIEGEGENLSKS